MSKLLDLFQGKSFSNPPVWFMRQAGRYLPEYRNIRKKHKTFLDLCYASDFATEITLQPLQRFQLDAAILFSDILVIPDALGQKVAFEEGNGPILSDLCLSSYQKKLSLDRFLEKLAPVYETIRLTKSELSATKALIGFAGAPWTLALYMLEGKGSRDFSKAKDMAFQDEKEFSMFLDYLSDVISRHLIEQAKVGVDILQLFDTWAGLCPATHFHAWVLKPTQKIVAAVKSAFPSLPMISFPKGIGVHLLDYGMQTGISALSLDASISLSWACQYLPQELILQGNLDPNVLVAGGCSLKKAVESIHQEMGGRSYIFNLGHGILPQTPIHHVSECIKWIRALS